MRGGSDSNSCAENRFQSQMETSLVLTKPGVILEERMMPLRETFLGDRIKASLSRQNFHDQTLYFRSCFLLNCGALDFKLRPEHFGIGMVSTVKSR